MDNFDPELERIAAAPPRSGFSWRVFWKCVCIGNICLTVLLALVSALFSSTRDDPTKSDLFAIFDALLALVQLLSLTMVGLAAIGWIVCKIPASRKDT